jgi:hypothetical protein
MKNALSAENILQALRDKDIVQLETWLEQGLPVSWKDEAGNTLLHAAAAFGDAGFAQKLLQKGALTAAFNNLDETPADIARQWGHDNLLPLLETSPQEPQSFSSLKEIRILSTKIQSCAFHMIVKRGGAKTLLDLAARDAGGFCAEDFLRPGKTGETALLEICRQGKLKDLMTPALWQHDPAALEKLWQKVPAVFRTQVDFQGVVSAIYRQKIQTQSKPRPRLGLKRD